MVDCRRGGRLGLALEGVAYGTADFLLGPLTAPRYAAGIPEAELVSLPGLGHVPMADNPRLVARTILDFTAPQSPTRARHRAAG